LSGENLVDGSEPGPTPIQAVLEALKDSLSPVRAVA